MALHENTRSTDVTTHPLALDVDGLRLRLADLVRDGDIRGGEVHPHVREEHRHERRLRFVSGGGSYVRGTRTGTDHKMQWPDTTYSLQLAVHVQ